MTDHDATVGTGSPAGTSSATGTDSSPDTGSSQVTEGSQVTGSAPGSASARGRSSSRAGVVSVFLTTAPPEELDEYRVLPVAEDGDPAPFRLEADAGLTSVDPELLEVDAFAEPADDPVAELTGYSAGASFADAAAVDLARLRAPEHTGLVLIYDHDARQGSGAPEGSALTLVGVYAYDWRL